MSRRKKYRGYDFDNFEITKREILASVTIIAVLLLIGVLISSKISEHQMDKNEVYNKAVKIKSADQFQYGMNTSVGNAFVYGDLKAVDTVNYPEIDGEYMYIKKVKERYTRHTRTVTKTKTVNGKTKTYTETEEYWKWDRVGSEENRCKEIKFCGVKFKSVKVDFPNSNYIDTVKESSHIRYKYYGVETKYIGTIFTKLKDKTISDKTVFYNNMNIEETVDSLESGFGVIIFWILWVIFIGVCVFIFYYIDNKWLEN